MTTPAAWMSRSQLTSLPLTTKLFAVIVHGPEYAASATPGGTPVQLALGKAGNAGQRPECGGACSPGEADRDAGADSDADADIEAPGDRDAADESEVFGSGAGCALGWALCG